jgi:hypothetical protein
MEKLLFALLAIALLFGCIAKESMQMDGQNKTNLTEAGNQTETINQTNSSPQEVAENSEPRITSFSVSTDKPAYISRENISVHVTAISDGDIPGVYLEAWGIRNNRGKEVLNQNELKHIKQGKNEAIFAHELGYCAVCTGMPGGEYFIFAQARAGDKVLANANCSFNFSLE